MSSKSSEVFPTEQSAPILRSVGLSYERRRKRWARYSLPIFLLIAFVGALLFYYLFVRFILTSAILGTALDISIEVPGSYLASQSGSQQATNRPKLDAYELVAKLAGASNSSESLTSIEKKRIEDVLAYGGQQPSVTPWMEAEVVAPSSALLETELDKIADAVQIHGSGSASGESIARPEDLLNEWTTEYYERIQGNLAWQLRRYFSGWVQFLTVLFFFFIVLWLLRDLLFLNLERQLVLRPGIRRPWGLAVFFRVSDFKNQSNLFTFLFPEGDRDDPGPERYDIEREKLIERVENFLKNASRISDPKFFMSANLIIELVDEVCRPGSSELSFFRLKTVLKEGIEDLDFQTDHQQHYIKWMIAALPGLGFIGTILGLSEGLGASYKTVKPDLNPVEEIQNLTTTLGVAFDTTLVALVLSLIATLAFAFVASQRDAFLQGLRTSLAKLSLFDQARSRRSS